MEGVLGDLFRRPLPVPWGKVTLPKPYGGLGVIDIHVQNWAMLTKWIWIAENDDPSLWRTTLITLYSTTPTAPSLTTQPKTFFLSDLRKIQPIMTATTKCNTNNSLLWNLTTTGHFMVNSAYHFLNNPGIPNPILQKIWPLQLPPKIKFFIWLLLQNKLQTAQNLQRKNWPAIHSCIMYTTTNQETTDHLFYTCPTARALHHTWPHQIIPLAGPAQILQSWCMAVRTAGEQQWAAVGWTIWKERNRRIFQQETKQLHAMKMEVSTYRAQWAICKRTRNRNRDRNPMLA
jgi:zinc-binding in reverse transcriptase